MTETHVLHAYNVLVGRIEDAELPTWKKEALLAKVEECHEILDSQDRRTSQRRSK